MALEKDKLTIDIELESGDANKAIEKLAESLKGLSKSTDKATDSTDDYNDSLEENQKEVKGAKKESKKYSDTLLNTAASITAVNQALEIGRKVYGAIKGVVDSTTEAFAVQEKAELDLANALKLNGQFTRAAFKDFKDFASELQNTTTVGDETTLGLLKIAKALNLTNEQSKAAVQAAAGLSAATGQDLNSSFQQVTKTFGGYAGELGEKLPAIRELSKEQLQAGEATKLLIDQFGGFASAARDTFSGQQIATANAFGDVLEEIGELFVSVFDLGGTAKSLEQFFITIGGQIAAFRERLVAVLNAVDFNKIIEPLKSIAMVIGTLLIPFLYNLLVPLGLVAAKFIAIGAAITGVIVIVDLLIRNMGQISVVFGAIGDIIAASFNKGAASIASFVSFLFEKLKQLIETIKGFGLLPDSLAESASASLDGFVAASDSAMESFEKSAADAAESASNSFSQLGDKGLLGGVLDTIGDIKGALNGLSTDAKGVSEDLKQMGNDAQEGLEKGAGATSGGPKGGGASGGQTNEKRTEIAGSETLSQVAAVFEAAFEGAAMFADGIMQAANFFQGISEQMVVGLSNMGNSVVDGIRQLPNFIAAGVEALSGVLEAFVTALPQAISKLLTMLPGLITKVFASLNEFFKQIPAIFMQIAEALPGLIQQVMEQLPTLLQNILRAIPQMIIPFIQVLPRIIIDMLKELPTIIGVVIEELIAAAGEIVAALVDELITKGGLVKIAVALVKGIVQSIGAIVTALSKGLQRAFKSIFKGVKAPEIDIGPFQESVEKVVDTAAKGAGKVAKEVFGLIDLPEDGQALAPPEDPAAKISEAFQQAGKAVGGYLDGAFAKLKSVWMFIWNTFLKPFTDLLKTAWMFIYKTFIEPGVKLWSAAFDVLKSILMSAVKVWQALFGTLKAIVSDAFSVVGDAFGVVSSILKNAFSAAIKFFSGLAGIVKKAFKAVMTFWKNIFKGNIAQAFKGIFDFFSTIPDLFMDAFRPILEFYENSFGQLVSFFKDSLMPFYENTFGRLVSFFTDQLLPFYQNSFGLLVSFFTKTFIPIIKSAFDPVMEVFQLIPRVLDYILNSYKTYFGALNQIFQAAIKPIKQLFDSMKGIFADAFKPLLNAFDVSNIAGVFQKVFDAMNPGNLLDKLFNFAGIDTKFKELFDNLNPLNLLNKMFSLIGGQGNMGQIEKLLGIDVPFVSFATGGFVPGKAMHQGDDKRNDTVPALLSPGEAVIPRSALEDPQVAALVQSIMDGSVQFAFGGVKVAPPKVSAPKVSTPNLEAPKIDFPKIDAPSLPTMNDVTKQIENLGESVKETLSSLDIATLLKEVERQIVTSLKNMISQTTGRMFSEGGLVKEPGFVETPGEFVFKKSAVDSIGASTLNDMNETGRMPGGDNISNVVNVEAGAINIQMVEGDSPQDIAERVIEEITRQTIDGRGIIFSSGVRAG